MVQAKRSPEVETFTVYGILLVNGEQYNYIFGFTSHLNLFYSHSGSFRWQVTSRK